MKMKPTCYLWFKYSLAVILLILLLFLVEAYGLIGTMASCVTRRTINRRTSADSLAGEEREVQWFDVHYQEKQTQCHRRCSGGFWHYRSIFRPHVPSLLGRLVNPKCPFNSRCFRRNRCRMGFFYVLSVETRTSERTMIPSRWKKSGLGGIRTLGQSVKSRLLYPSWATSPKNNTEEFLGKTFMVINLFLQFFLFFCEIFLVSLLPLVALRSLLFLVQLRRALPR